MESIPGSKRMVDRARDPGPLGPLPVLSLTLNVIANLSLPLSLSLRPGQRRLNNPAPQHFLYLVRAKPIFIQAFARTVRRTNIRRKPTLVSRVIA